MADCTVLGIVGSVTADSRTRAVVERALDAAADAGSNRSANVGTNAATDVGTNAATDVGTNAATDVETEILHLAEYDLDTADGRHLDDYDGDTAAALERIVEADAYVVGTPVYRGSLSGALKNLLDMVPRGRWQADVAPFENAAVGLVATGATDHHYLAIDQELRPLLAFFGAHAVGGSVYVNGDAFDDGNAIVDDDVADRLSTLGASTVELAWAVAESDALSALGPQF